MAAIALAPWAVSRAVPAEVERILTWGSWSQEPSRVVMTLEATEPITRFDVLYGWKTIGPEFACRVVDSDDDEDASLG